MTKKSIDMLACSIDTLSTKNPITIIKNKITGTDKSALGLMPLSFPLKIKRKLNKRERIVVDLFFLHEKSQEEIAHRLNISQMHISRILKSSVITLKKYLTE